MTTLVSGRRSKSHAMSKSCTENKNSL